MRPPDDGRRTSDQRRSGDDHHRGADPRLMVVAVALTALVVGGSAVAVLLASLQPTRSSVTRISESLSTPKNALLAAERANDAGQASLAAAAGATGDQRSSMLTESIDHAQEASTEWDRYQSSAVGLPGEKDLAERYVIDQAASHDISTASLVPILNSTVPGVLPQEEVAAHQAVRDDLVKMHTLYREADATALTELGHQEERTQQLLVFWAVVWGLVVAVGSIVGLRNARRVVAAIPPPSRRRVGRIRGADAARPGVDRHRHRGV